MEVNIPFLNEEIDVNWGIIKEFALVLFLLKTIPLYSVTY